MVISLLLAGMTAMVGAQAPVQAPAASQNLTVLVERVVRMADLQQQKLDLEHRLADLGLGENHPEVLNLRAELAALQTAIRREEYVSYLTESQQLENQRADLERELATTGLGSSHPIARRLNTQIATVREQQRQAATERLMSGIETDLRTAIDRAPDNLAPYLDLARLYAAAQRPVDAEAVLMSAIAVLKKSTGR
jgi:hypothetical protein